MRQLFSHGSGGKKPPASLFGPMDEPSRRVFSRRCYLRSPSPAHRPRQREEGCNQFFHTFPFRGGRVREEARSKKILTKKDKIVYILAGEKSPQIFAKFVIAKGGKEITPCNMN
jgi:hypothetical protein